MSFLAYRTGSHDDFLWNGDVATRVDCVPQRLNSSRNIYPKGWVILARSFVLEDECFIPEGGWWRLIARNSAVSLYGTIYWSALHCWWWSGVIASDPTRGSRHDFPSGTPGRTLLFSCLLITTRQWNSRTSLFMYCVVTINKILDHNTLSQWSATFFLSSPDFNSYWRPQWSTQDFSMGGFSDVTSWWRKNTTICL